MTKSQSTAAVLEAPDPKPDTKNVKILDPDGVVFEDRILKTGTFHDLPRTVADRLISQGRVKVTVKSYFVATTTVFFNNRLYDRGEVGEFDGPISGPYVEAGSIIPVSSPEAPAVMPPAPTDEKSWRLGPRVTVEALAPGHLGPPGTFAENAGDRFTLREPIAVELLVLGRCKILEPLSAAGVEFRDRLAKSNGDPFKRPRYVDVAQRLRRAPRPPGGPADDSPLILVRALRSCPIDGKPREAGKTYRVAESVAATAWQMGALELLEKPSKRLLKFASNYSAYAQNPVMNAFPQY